MIRVLVTLTLLGPGIVLAQPQRIERDVARSKATLAQALAEKSWKDGELVTTQGRVSAADNGANQFRYHKTGWSGLSAAQQAASGWYVNTAGDAYLEAVDRTEIHWAKWGIVADGVTDDSAALQAMLDATQLNDGATIILPTKKTILLGSSVTLSGITRPITIEGNGCTITSAVNIFELTGNSTTLTINGDVAVGSRTIDVVDASSVSTGDIVRIGSDVLYDTGWGYKCWDTRRVEGISGNTITCNSPANLGYTAATDTITVVKFDEAYIDIRDLTFRVSGVDNALELRGLGGKITDCQFFGPDSAQGLYILSCVDIEVRRCTLKQWTYGALILYSRFVKFYDIIAKDIQTHPISTASASSNVVIDGLVSSGGQASVESHPTFYTTYRNVKADGGGLNCRAFGVVLENIEITNANLDVVPISPTYSQLNIVRFPHLETAYTWTLNNVTYLPTQSSSTACDFQIRMSGKRAAIDNCRIPGIVTGASGGFRSLADGLFISNSTLGYVSPNTGNTPVYVVDSVIDQDLNLFQTEAVKLYGTAPQRYTAVKFNNFDPSDTFSDQVNAIDVLFTACSIGTFDEFCTSELFDQTPGNYRFVGCDITLTNDAIIGFDLNTFQNCKGAIAGSTLTGRGALLDEDAMTSNSAIAAPSQQSVKAYVDANIPTIQLHPVSYVNATRTALGHWQLQDNAASTTVVNLYGANGTLVGGDDTADIAVTGPTTYLNSALDFDGTADYVTQSRYTTGAVTALTVSARIKAPTAGSARTIASEADLGANQRQWQFALDSSNRLEMYVTEGGGVSPGWKQVRTNTALVAGTWYYVTARFDGTSGTGLIDLFIDDTKAATTTVQSATVNAIHDGTAPFRIGSASNSGAIANPYDGEISDVIVEQRFWQDYEIAALENPVLLDANRLIGSIIDEDDFASNSSARVPSQQSTKAYVDAHHGHAQISIEDNATATTVASTQSDWSAKSQFTLFGTNFADSSNATPDHTNDHITLTSAGVWEVTCVLTCSGSVVSDLWELALWKNNGATQVSTKQGVNIRGAGLTYEKQVTISGLVDASANDTIELWVQRTNGTGTLTITNAVLTAKKVSD